MYSVVKLKMVAPGVVGCATSKIQLSKIKLAFFASACRFQSAKHFSKRAELRNGREVLPGTPGRRHGISAIEAADRTSDHEPTIHWLVSRTSAACREGSRKHLSPSAMRSEPVGRDCRYRRNFASPKITRPLHSATLSPPWKTPKAHFTQACKGEARFSPPHTCGSEGKGGW